MSTGKRYSKDEKKEILAFRQTHTMAETMEKFGVSLMTLARWNKADRETYRIQIHQEHLKNEPNLKLPSPETLQSLLRVIKSIDNVTGVAVIDDNGQNIGSILNSPLNEDIILPLTAALLAAHDRVCSMLKLGNLTSIMSQGTKGLYLLLGISPNHVLVLIYSEKADPQQIINQDMPIINLIADEMMMGQD